MAQPAVIEIAAARAVNPQPSPDTNTSLVKSPPPPPLPAKKAPALSSRRPSSAAPAVSAAAQPRKGFRTPEPADSGELFIHCTPWAQIHIDNKDWGKTPMDKPVKLGAGTHYIKLYNEFCEPFETSVTVVPGTVVRKRYALKVKPAYRK
jgi:hypothetical protein